MRTIPNISENAELGITWSTEEVSQKNVVVCTHAQIPVMQDVQKFHAAFPHYILAMSNGSSMRVLAQGICRRMSKDSPEAQRAAILNAIRGIRNQSRSVVTVEKRTFVIPTPTGDLVSWSGTDAAEFLAALVDGGFDAATAQNIVKKLM